MTIFQIDDAQAAIASLLQDFYGLDAETAQGDARLLAEAALSAAERPTPPAPYDVSMAVFDHFNKKLAENLEANQ